MFRFGFRFSGANRQQNSRKRNADTNADKRSNQRKPNPTPIPTFTPPIPLVSPTPTDLKDAVNEFADAHNFNARKSALETRTHRRKDCFIRHGRDGL